MPMAKKPDAVSLYFEISQVTDALEGARAVLYALNEVGDGLGGPAGRQALESGLSMIGLLVARLRLVGRVLYGDADPATLVTPQNQVPASIAADLRADALLRPWSEDKKAEAAAQQIRSRQARDRR